MDQRNCLQLTVDALRDCCLQVLGYDERQPRAANLLWSAIAFRLRIRTGLPAGDAYKLQADFYENYSGKMLNNDLKMI